MAVKTSGNRGGWFSAVTVLMMDRGNTPLSIEQLTTLAARRVGPTARNDGYVTSRDNGGDPNSYKDGWAIIVDELVALLREHGFVNGDLRWIGSTDGQINWGGKKYSIRPAAERQERRDYHMVTLGSKADYGEVQILGARGGITKKRLEVHPLAHLLPQIPRSELAELRKDIDENGILVPLLMFEDKVLDGRHRLYLATVLGKPVRLETFEGSEEEARARVGSLNLFRRHLTVGQRGQLITDLYMAEAKEEAAEAKKEGNRAGGSGGKSTPSSGSTSGGKTAAQIAAAKGNNAVGKGVIEAIQVAQQFPDLVKRLRDGSITPNAAQKQARERLAEKAPPEVDVWKTTVNLELGRSLGHLRKVRDDLELAPGAEAATITERLDEIETIVREVRSALEQRSAI